MNKLLLNTELWFSIYNNFKERSPQQRHKINVYKDILDSKKYISLANEILNKKYKFSLPKRLEINKLDTQKKKIIYIYNHTDDFVLKVISKILTTKYSHLISPACHSFQINKGAKTAFKSILKDKSIHKKYVFKTDISNFFNSIDTDHFFEVLPSEIKQNSIIMYVLNSVLKNEYVIRKTEIIKEKKGLMAGTALAPFLSNIYLNKIDKYFVSQGITYARYSDDIIFFDDEKSLNQNIKYFRDTLKKQNLNINESKTKIIKPNNEWIFLGFSYNQGTIDIAKSTQLKFKRKIRRLSKRYYKKHTEGKFTETETLTFFINKINKKLLGKNFDDNDLCWTRWFFPLINTSKSLKMIDKFVQDKLRYSVNGRYSKLNYKKTPYTILQELNYQPINKLYYLFKLDFEKFNNIVQIYNISLQT